MIEMARNLFETDLEIHRVVVHVGSRSQHRTADITKSVSFLSNLPYGVHPLLHLPPDSGLCAEHPLSLLSRGHLFCQTEQDLAVVFLNFIQELFEL